MSEIRDRVAAKLSIIICGICQRNVENLCQIAADDDCPTVAFYTCAILDIPNLTMVDREASLPKNPYPVLTSTLRIGYDKAQQAMLKACYIKEVKG